MPLVGQGLLRRNRDFRLLFGGRAISDVGSGMALVALLLHVEEAEGSGVAIALLALALTVPSLLAGLVAGTVVDRTEQRTLMIACDIGRALLYATLALLLPPLPILLAIVAVGAALDAAFSPAVRSSVPAFVADDDLRAANAWLGTAVNLQVLLGPLLGGVLTGAYGAGIALGGNALTFVASAALLSRLPPVRHTPIPTEDRPLFLADVRAGFSYVTAHAAARVVVMSLVFGVTFAAVDNVGLVFLVRDVFDASAAAFGAVGALFGVGMLACSLALTSARVSLAAGALFLLGLVPNGSGTLLTGVAPTLALAAIVYALAGAGNAIQNIAADTLVQKTVAPHMLGRTFSLVRAGAVAGSAVSALGAGVLLDQTSPRAVFIVGGVGVLAVAAATSIFLPRATAR